LDPPGSSLRGLMPRSIMGFPTAGCFHHASCLIMSPPLFESIAKDARDPGPGYSEPLGIAIRGDGSPNSGDCVRSTAKYKISRIFRPAVNGSVWMTAPKIALSQEDPITCYA